MLRVLISFLFVFAPVVAYAQTKTLTFCAYDYMANCSEYVIGSEAAKQCMLDVGIDLSPRCVNALIEDGYITKQQVIDFAKKKGVTVVDTPEGLKKVDKDTAVAKVEEIKPTAVPVEDITPPKKVTTEPIAPLPGDVTPSKQTRYEEPIVETKPVERKVYVKKSYKVHKANKDDWKLPNTKYAKLPRIKEQNRLRRKASQRDIVADGVDADFGRYEPRPKGYSRKRFKYSWKKHMQDHANGMIRSGGINAQF